MFMRAGLRFLKALAAVNPRAWFFLVGLACLWRGAESLHAGAGWLLVGLVLVWDSARENTPAK